MRRGVWMGRCVWMGRGVWSGRGVWMGRGVLNRCGIWPCFHGSLRLEIH